MSLAEQLKLEDEIFSFELNITSITQIQKAHKSTPLEPLGATEKCG